MHKKTETLIYQHVTIKDVIYESDLVTTFIFSDKRCEHAKAGQFVMVWLPTIGERPMSLSWIGSNCAISVKKIGKFTHALCNLKKGDTISIRGPYGNGFPIIGDSILLIAGGMGIAPILAFSETLHKRNIHFKIIYGVKSAEDIIFLPTLEKYNTLIVSEDQTHLTCGLAVNYIEDELTNNYDMIAGCGPELMLRCIIDMSEKIPIPIYLSLERYIKCGIGLCGACNIDPFGKMVCHDGPVFNAKDLIHSEIGKYRRDSSGTKRLL